MRAFIFIWLMGVGFFLPAQTNFSINLSESPCQWMGSAVGGLYSIEGTLEIDSGNLWLKGDSLLQADLRVDMKSLETDNKTVRKHLKGGDFFDVKTFQIAQFTLGTPLLLQDGPGIVQGIIEVKGIRKAINISLTVTKKKKTIKLDGVLLLDRTDYGITYNSPNFFDNLGDQAISDEIEFRFSFLFERD